MSALGGGALAGETAGQAVALVRNLALVNWYLWTLPFRLSCRGALFLFIRLVARPADAIQPGLLGRRVVEVEKLARGLSAAVKPLWYRAFPFERPDSASPARPSLTRDEMGRDAPPAAGFGGAPAHGYPFAGDAAGHQDAPHARMPPRSARDGPDIIDPDEDTDDQGFYPGQGKPGRPGDDPFTFQGGEHDDGRRAPPLPRRRKRPGRHHRRDDDLHSEASSARLPRSAANMSAAEVDKAVMLAIEAKQTHNVVEKLFWVAVVLMGIVGLVLYRIDFTRKWGGTKVGHVDPALAFEGVYGTLVVLTIAFRSDFPFNLGVLMLVLFFAGIVFGTIIARAAFAIRK